MHINCRYEAECCLDQIDYTKLKHSFLVGQLGATTPVVQQGTPHNGITTILEMLEWLHVETVPFTILAEHVHCLVA